MSRIYHPFWLWEDVKNGILEDKSEIEEELSTIVRDLLSDSKLFYKTAKKMVKDWKYASEFHLSNRARNRQAWIGQASCCYLYKIPEKITKYGWRLLSFEQQIEANKVADRIIIEWEKENAKKIS